MTPHDNHRHAKPSRGATGGLPASASRGATTGVSRRASRGTTAGSRGATAGSPSSADHAHETAPAGNWVLSEQDIEEIEELLAVWQKKTEK